MTDGTVLVVPEIDPMDPAYLAAVGFLAGFDNANTRDAYRLDLKIWFDWCIEHRLNPLEAKRMHIQAYVVHLAEQRRNGPATINRRIGTITGYYETCELDDYIERSPAHRIKLPRIVDDPTTKTWLNRFELGSLMRVARASTSTDWALISILGTLGLRVSAACGIRVEDFSTTNDGYRVLRTVGKGKKASIKVVPIPVGQAVDAAIDGRTSGWLLVRRNGSQMTRRSADRVVQRLGKQAGIHKRLSPHVLRRSFATLALQAGVDLRVVQDGMDHSSARSTATYDALGVPLHGQAANVMAAMLASSS